MDVLTDGSIFFPSQFLFFGQPEDRPASQEIMWSLASSHSAFTQTSDAHCMKKKQQCVLAIRKILDQKTQTLHTEIEWA